MVDSSLAKKLQIKPGYRVVVVNEPERLRELLGALPEGVTLLTETQIGVDMAVLFAQDSQVLKRDAAATLAILKPDGILWIAYPKKTSGIETDLTRDEGWEVIKPLGLTGVSNVKIDDIWSGLRFKRAAHETGTSQIEAQYQGKEHLRPLYDRLIEMGLALGHDVTLNVRQSYVAITRGKQFAAIAPTTKTRLDLGLRLKGLDSPLSGRVTEAKNVGGGSITHKISLTTLDEIDAEVKTLLWTAYQLVG